MSKQIKDKLQSVFSDLHKELLKSDLAYLLTSDPQEIQEEDDFYYIDIPLKDGSGSLEINYDTDNDEYGLGWQKNLPLHYGIYCYDIREDLDKWLDGKDWDYGYNYWEEDDKDVIYISCALEGRPGRLSVKDKSQLLEGAHNSLKVLNKYYELVLKESRKPNFYDTVEKSFKKAVEIMSQEEPAISTEDLDISIEDYIDNMSIHAYPTSSDDAPDLRIAWSLDETLEVVADGKRHGVTQKKCDELASCFLENDDVEYWYSEGRGEEATFSFGLNLDYKRKDFNASSPAYMAEQALKVFRKTREFEALLAKGDAFSLESIKPVPDKYSPFAKFCSEIRQKLENGAIPGWRPLPGQADAMHWFDGGQAIACSIFFDAPCFQLLLIYHFSPGVLDMEIKGFRYGVTAAASKEILNRLIVHVPDHGVNSSKFSGRGIKSIFSLTFEREQDYDRKPGSLKCADELPYVQKFYEFSQYFIKLLKKDSPLGPDESREAIKAMVEANISVLPRATESRAASRPEQAINPEMLAPVAESRTPAEEAGPQNHEQTPAPASQAAPEPLASSQPAPEPSVEIAHNAEFSPKQIKHFEEAAQKLLGLMRSCDKFASDMPASLPEPVSSGEALYFLIPLANSSLSLRIRLHQEDNLMDMGWLCEFNPSLFYFYQHACKKFTRKHKVKSFVNKETNAFSVFWELEQAKGGSQEEALESLCHKVINGYADALQLKKDGDEQLHS